MTLKLTQFKHSNDTRMSADVHGYSRIVAAGMEALW